MQFFDIDVFFAFRKSQRVFLFHGLADRHVPDSLVMLADELRIVLYPVVDNMQVRMFGIAVPHDDILRIGYVHPLHILPGQLPHQIVGQPRRIVRMERQRDMPHDLGLFGPGFALEIEAADRFPRIGRIHAVRRKKPRVGFVHHVPDRAFETLSGYYFTDHGNILLSVLPHRRKNPTVRPTGVRLRQRFFRSLRSVPVDSDCSPAGRVRRLP